MSMTQAQAHDQDHKKFFEEMLRELRSMLNVDNKLVEVREAQDEFGYTITIKYHDVEIDASYSDDVYDVKAAASCCLASVVLTARAISNATLKDAIEAIKAKASYALVAYAKALKAFADSIANEATHDDDFDIASFAATIIIDEIEASMYTLADLADVLGLADEKREIVAMADSLDDVKEKLKVYAMGLNFGPPLLIHRP